MARLARVERKTTVSDKLTQQNISEPTTCQTLKWIVNSNRNLHQFQLLSGLEQETKPNLDTSG